MEVLVVILFATVMLLTVQTLISAIALSVRQKHLEQASALAHLQIETLRAFPYASLTNRTNAAFRGILWNNGTWQVAIDASAPSSPNAYASSPSGTTGTTSTAQVPVGTVGDFTLELNTLAAAASPPGWALGALFRAEDDANTYRVSIAANDITLERLIEGTATTLYTSAQSFSLGSWETIEIVATGTSIQLSLNGTLLATVTDTTYSKGVLALWGSEGARASFDTVTVTTGLGTEVWDFDADTQGENPLVWRRFGVHDLPQGIDELTISDYLGSTDIKQVTARIRWQERGSRSVELSSLINRF